MRQVCQLLVAAVIHLYPRSFRRRFAEELLTAFHDQFRSKLELPAGAHWAALKFTVATTLGLLRSLIPSYLDQRRRNARILSRNPLTHRAVEKLLTAASSATVEG